jgi:hypothetical protein
MKSSLRSPALAVASLALASTASAQVLLSSATYTQNFNAFHQSGDLAWVDNNAAPGVGESSLQGWYVNYSAPGTAVTSVIHSAGTGSSTTPRIWSYGANGAGTIDDRAFGALTSANATSGTGTVTLALRLTNTTGQTIDEVSVAYTGEQWRTSGATPRTMSFGYSTTATGATTGTYTAVSSLNFVSPAPGASATLDGNAAANRTVFSATTLSGTALGWAPGADLWLRWQIPTTGSAQGLSLDDLTVNATLAPIPEPASVGALFGLATIGLAAARRRRSAR